MGLDGMGFFSNGVETWLESLTAVDCRPAPREESRREPVELQGKVEPRVVDQPAMRHELHDQRARRGNAPVRAEPNRGASTLVRPAVWEH